jgi:hypothetical protein
MSARLECCATPLAHHHHRGKLPPLSSGGISSLAHGKWPARELSLRIVRRAHGAAPIVVIDLANILSMTTAAVSGVRNLRAPRFARLTGAARWAEPTVNRGAIRQAATQGSSS